MSTERETVTRYVVYQRLLPIEDRLKSVQGTDVVLATDYDAIQQRCEALDKEVARLKDANAHWHVRVEQMKQQLAARVLKWREPGVPKEAGYYWYRPDAEWEPWAVRLVYDKYGLPEIHWTQEDGTGVTQRGIEHCQFAGPIAGGEE